MKTKIYQLIILMITLCAVQTHAQEICNNGIDDDGDGKGTGPSATYCADEVPTGWILDSSNTNSWKDSISIF